jgi:hypothetical protein
MSLYKKDPLAQFNCIPLLFPEARALWHAQANPGLWGYTFAGISTFSGYTFSHCTYIHHDDLYLSLNTPPVFYSNDLHVDYQYFHAARSFCRIVCLQWEVQDIVHRFVAALRRRDDDGRAGTGRSQLVDALATNNIVHRDVPGQPGMCVCSRYVVDRRTGLTVENVTDPYIMGGCLYQKVSECVLPKLCIHGALG